MGTEMSRMRMEGPLKDLLRANGIPLETKTARTKCREAIKQGEEVLEEIKEERSKASKRASIRNWV